MCTSHCSNEIVEAIIVALAPACPDRAMGGWGRRLRIALDGARSAQRAAVHLAHVPGAAGRRRVARPASGGPRSANGTRPAASSSAASRWRRRGSRCCSKPTSSARGRRALGGIAAGSAATMRLRVETDGPAVANTAGEGVVHGARGDAGRGGRRPARLSAGRAGCGGAATAEQGSGDRRAGGERARYPLGRWRGLGVFGRPRRGYGLREGAASVPSMSRSGRGLSPRQRSDRLTVH